MVGTRLRPNTLKLTSKTEVKKMLVKLKKALKDLIKKNLKSIRKATLQLF